MTNKNKEYWDSLDKQCEEWDKPFREDKFISVEEHDYVVGKLIRQAERWPGTSKEEFERIAEQYKTIIFDLQDKEERMAHILRRHLNFTEEMMEYCNRLRLEVENTIQYLHHTNECYFIGKLSSGRKVEVDEKKDCNCGFFNHVARFEQLVEANRANEKVKEELEEMRRDFLYKYG